MRQILIPFASDLIPYYCAGRLYDVFKPGAPPAVVLELGLMHAEAQPGCCGLRAAVESHARILKTAVSNLYSRTGSDPAPKDLDKSFMAADFYEVCRHADNYFEPAAEFLILMNSEDSEYWSCAPGRFQLASLYDYAN